MLGLIIFTLICVGIYFWAKKSNEKRIAGLSYEDKVKEKTIQYFLSFTKFPGSYQNLSNPKNDAEYDEMVRGYVSVESLTHIEYG